MIRSRLALLALLSALSGCAAQSQTRAWVVGDIPPEPTRMSQAEVLSLAQRFATERGFRLADYKRPRLSLYSGDRFKPDKVWSLWFWEKHHSRPGGYLLINVDDKTGRAEIEPSR